MDGAKRCPRCNGLVMYDPLDDEQYCLYCGYRATTTLEEIEPNRTGVIRRRDPYRKSKLRDEDA